MARRGTNGSIRQTLDVHASAIATLSAKVGSIEGTLHEHGKLLADIRTALTRHEATKPVSAREWLGIAREGVILAAAFTALIYFIVRPEINDLSKTVSRLEKQVELAARPEPVPKIVYRTVPLK